MGCIYRVICYNNYVHAKMKADENNTNQQRNNAYQFPTAWSLWACVIVSNYLKTLQMNDSGLSIIFISASSVRGLNEY